MNKIDISNKEEVLKQFNSFTKKGDIYEFYHISDNSEGCKYVRKIAEEIGFDLETYSKRKKKYCLFCGKELKKQQKKFCSKSCAAKINNTKREKKENKNTSYIKNRYLNVLKEGKKTNKQFICEYCGKEFFGNYERRFCSNKCCSEFNKEKRILEWKSGDWNICGEYTIPDTIREYLLKKCNYCCEKCGFSGVNEKSGKTILQIHHKDGDSTNNKEENLQVLCPNCHAMTENYMGLNKGKSGRKKRYK